MKKFRFQLVAVLTACCSLGFMSCNNEESFVTEELSQDFQLETAISIDSLFAIDNEEVAKWSSNRNKIPQTRSSASVTEMTVYGYDSQTTTGNRKTLISSDLATKMGIPRQIYIMETLTLYKNITINGLNSTVYFASDYSPNCGISPANQDSISYTSTMQGNTMKLATKLHHVISDMNGISYNRWYPREPNSLEWNYKLITFN